MNPIVLSTAVALGIGLLIGVERERSKGSGPDREIGGVRTFTLTALLGAFCASLQNELAFAAFAILIGAMSVAGYLRTRTADPGITTEVALFITFVLGALSLSHPAYSGGAAVVVTVLLFSRPWLHEIVQRRLSDRELHDALLLAAAALVVLPLLPDHTVDPWGVFNPHKIWVVVVLVMIVNALGYIGLRLWGHQKGLLLAGLLGGLVSSVMTHNAMGLRCKANPALINSAAAAATTSSVTTAVFLLVVVAAVDIELAKSLLPELIAAAAVNTLAAALLFARARTTEHAEFPPQEFVNLRAALVFGALVSAVLIASTLLSRELGAGAALAGTAVAGFADTHSGAISAATLMRNGMLSFENAQVAVLLSFTTNAITKIAVSAIAGGARYALRIVWCIAASVCATWIMWGISRYLH